MKKQTTGNSSGSFVTSLLRSSDNICAISEPKTKGTVKVQNSSCSFRVPHPKIKSMKFIRAV